WRVLRACLSAYVASAFVTAPREFLEAEFLHQLDLVTRHRALGIRFVVGARLGLAGSAVAAQVGTNNRVVLRESRRDLRPHGVRLREAVEQEQRGAGSAMSQA